MTEDDARKIARALLDELFARIGGGSAPIAAAAPSSDEPTFMKVATYAKKRGYARSTIQKYLDAGMPSVPGRGGRRVDVRAADAWIRMGAGARELHS